MEHQERRESERGEGREYVYEPALPLVDGYQEWSSVAGPAAEPATGNPGTTSTDTPYPRPLVSRPAWGAPLPAGSTASTSTVPDWIPVEAAPPTRRTPRRGVGGILGRLWPFLLMLLAKAKWLLVIFKFKAFTTFLTMLISLWFYARFFGLPFALGFIALLFIHEMGHALEMRRQGLQATVPIFIPFMGALIGMKQMPRNAYAEAKMALAGPIVGSAGALACLVLWQATGSLLFVALAYTGCWLNLFNLLPVSPLDGGRAMAAISPWGWGLGLALLLLLFFRVHSLFLGVILLVGGMEVYNRWRSRGLQQAYYEVSGRDRLTIAATYFGLAATLALAMFALQTHLLANQPGW